MSTSKFQVAGQRAKGIETSRSKHVERAGPDQDHSRAVPDLSEAQVDALMKSARAMGRHGHRDATMILLMHRQALAVSELCALRWRNVDLKGGWIVSRKPDGGSQPARWLSGAEISALGKLEAVATTPFVFDTGRGGALAGGLVLRMLDRAGQIFDFSVHPAISSPAHD